MGLSIYTGNRRVDSKLLLVLMAINACFAITILFAWTVVSVLVAEPISWATWAPLSHGSRPELFDYPFVVLWAFPALGVVGAWMAKNVYKERMAYLSVTVPIVMMSLIFGYYYFVPTQYH